MRRIVHISDVHFGPHFLPEVAEGVLEFIAEREPHLVVISGDLTQRAKPRQFREARAFADRIEVPTVVVPGNHDVPLYRFWERIFSPFGAYSRHFSPELEPSFHDEEMAVVGINTAFGWTLKDGRITLGRLRRAAEQLGEAPSDRVRLVVLHHQLIPAPRFGSQRVLTNAWEALELFGRLDVEVVFAGHLHQAWVGLSEGYYPSGGRPILVVHAGTTTSGRGRGSERGRNTLNVVEIDDKEITVGHHGWEGALGRFIEWSRHRYPRRSRPVYELSSREHR